MTAAAVSKTAAPPIIGTLTVFGAALMFSINNVAIPLVYQHGSEAFSLVAARYLVLCGVIVILGLTLRQSLLLPRRDWFAATGAGTASVLAVMALLASIIRLPVGLAILLLYTYPIMTGLMTSVVSRTWPGLGQFACLAVALAGVAISLQIDHFVLDPIGLCLGIAAAFLYSVSLIWSGRALRQAPPLALSLHMAVCGYFISWALVFAGHGFQPPTDQSGWLALLVCAVAFSLGFLGIYRGVQLAGPMRTTMLMNIEPVLTAAFAFVMLGEPLTAPKFIGGAIVIAAVLASQLLGLKTPSAVTSG